MNLGTLQLKKKYRAIHTILLEEWDPIGIKGEPSAADEYDSYITEIYQLLESGAKSYDIGKYLGRIENIKMGLQGSSPEHLETVAVKLIELSLDNQAE